jgi:hypothetical protein
VKERSEVRVEAIKALPIRVLGDPEWLRPRAVEEEEGDETELGLPSHVAGAFAGRIAAAAAAATRRQSS